MGFKEITFFSIRTDDGHTRSSYHRNRHVPMARKAASQYLRDREKEESNYLLKQALTSIFALTQKIRVTIAATIDRYSKHP